MKIGLRRIWKLSLLVASLGILVFASWLLLLKPFQLTKLHGQEMASAIQRFREVEFAFETRLQPDLLLSVATKNYLPSYLNIIQVGMCEQCDRFWITTSAEVKGIRVIECSKTRCLVRAEVVEQGHRVNSRTHERLTSYDVANSDTATYLFVRDADSNQWLLEDILDSRVPNLMNPGEITLDDLILFDLENVLDK